MFVSSRVSSDDVTESRRLVISNDDAIRVCDRLAHCEPLGSHSSGQVGDRVRVPVRREATSEHLLGRKDVLIRRK